jgi:hypothetical protein
MQLPLATTAKLSRAEAIALVLYTGPMVRIFLPRSLLSEAFFY